MSQELIAKLESASKGSRELDALVWCATIPGGATYDVSRNRVTYPDKAWAMIADFEPVTTSIDAALALAERVLPGKGWEVLYSGLMNWRAHTPTGLQRLPLLVCAALLRASAAEGAGHG